MYGCWVYITEDLSVQVVRARRELRKFLVRVKASAPLAQYYLHYDKVRQWARSDLCT